MPIYEYECTSCCHVFEVFQRMTEDPLSICPDCSGPVRKLVSMSSFQLKGSGWYADGYSSKQTSSSGSSAPVTPAEKASATADTTPKSTSDATPTPKSKESCPATA